MVAPAILLFAMLGGLLSSSIGSYVFLDLPRVETECVGYYDDESVIKSHPNAIIGGTYKLFEYVHQQLDPTYVTVLFDFCRNTEE